MGTGGLLLRPSDNLGAEPELDASLAEVEHGPWHVAVPLLVLVHGISVGKAEDFGDAVCVDQVVGINRSHFASLHRYADPSEVSGSLTL